MGATIEGVLLNADGTGRGRIFIVARTEGLPAVATRTDAHGNFALTGLDYTRRYTVRPAIYTVRAGTETLVPSHVENVVPGGRALRFEMRRNQHLLIGRVSEALRKKHEGYPLELFVKSEGQSGCHIEVKADGSFRQMLGGPGPFELRLMTVLSTGRGTIHAPAPGFEVMTGVMADGRPIDVR